MGTIKFSTWWQEGRYNSSLVAMAARIGHRVTGKLAIWGQALAATTQKGNLIGA